jgi:ATP-dependent Clp protease ATP-binding subunit ClpC
MDNVVSTILDPTLQNADAAEFEAALNHKVVGQPEAAKIVTTVIQSYMAGLNDPSRPIATLLLLGPTGTGKTRSLRPS